jgi:hypothetical protein
MDLHIGFETVEPYPFSIEGDQPIGTCSAELFEWFAVEKMRWAGTPALTIDRRSSTTRGSPSPAFRTRRTGKRSDPGQRLSG